MKLSLTFPSATVATLHSTAATLYRPLHWNCSMRLEEGEERALGSVNGVASKLKALIGPDKVDEDEACIVKELLLECSEAIGVSTEPRRGCVEDKEDPVNGGETGSEIESDGGLGGGEQYWSFFLFWFIAVWVSGVSS